MTTTSTTPLPRSVPRQNLFTTSDGNDIPLWRYGSSEPSVTYVLLHGWTLDHRSWDKVAQGLVRAEPDVQVITYDHRGHGASSPFDPASATLERLADDLAELINAEIPEGPLVLGGHSMGGMTIMTLAERDLELIVDRVVGAAFVATSAGRFYPNLRRSSLFRDRVLPGAFVRMEEAAQRGSSDRAARMNARMSLFGRGAPRADLDRAVAMTRLAQPGVTVGFGQAIADHDRIHALDGFRDIPTVVLAGSVDRLCPPRHLRTIAASLPLATYSEYEGAGHMLPFERSDAVVGRLRSLRPVTTTIDD